MSCQFLWGYTSQHFSPLFFSKSLLWNDPSFMSIQLDPGWKAVKLEEIQVATSVPLLRVHSMWACHHTWLCRTRSLLGKKHGEISRLAGGAPHISRFERTKILRSSVNLGLVESLHNIIIYIYMLYAVFIYIKISYWELQVTMHNCNVYYKKMFSPWTSDEQRHPWNDQLQVIDQLFKQAEVDLHFPLQG